ncbi:uncharacterized protein BT62DRAFT_921398 [Guyanagaster necrorhizus]|uniref:Uncharacterized protein n=1 Tax=Guyanagaster necrorhizus TaxID=856835 RepID=A0A9P7VMV9_9AGAR|nr:uncharacterized protein BT62DRAFT_921398 [Guyanagaster necrorhizus MCA 3950]KAG7444121.1 hypothetical protein BT62DRAFT_921398 [Guyanagaster necrorhizus MCA 3950]
MPRSVGTASETLNPDNAGMPLAKSLEEIEMDKMRAKMSKDVEMRNARRAQRGKDMEAKGQDPQDVSDDEEDESELVVETVQRAVEAKGKSSEPLRTTNPIVPAIMPTTAAASATSMDSALTTMFSDDKRRGMRKLTVLMKPPSTKITRLCPYIESAFPLPCSTRITCVTSNIVATLYHGSKLHEPPPMEQAGFSTF